MSHLLKKPVYCKELKTKNQASPAKNAFLSKKGDRRSLPSQETKLSAFEPLALDQRPPFVGQALLFIFHELSVNTIRINSVNKNNTANSGAK